MNERIRELAEQAGFPPARTFSDLSDLYPRLDKFAELIIRECIVDFYRNYLDTTSDEDITEQVDKYVTEHFGVEE